MKSFAIETQETWLVSCVYFVTASSAHEAERQVREGEVGYADFECHLDFVTSLSITDEFEEVRE